MPCFRHFRLDRERLTLQISGGQVDLRIASFMAPGRWILMLGVMDLEIGFALQASIRKKIRVLAGTP